MQHIANHAMMAELREPIERLAGRCDPNIPTSIMNATQSFLTALEYEDVTLMRSSLETALLEMAQVMNEEIQKRLGWPIHSREALRSVWEVIQGHPLENWDELGSNIDARFDDMLKVLVDLRDGPVQLFQHHGYDIESAEQLESDIKELQDLKKGILEEWPWSNRELPPVDQEMLNASLAALKSGEKGECIEDLITRLGGKIDKP